MKIFSGVLFLGSIILLLFFSNRRLIIYQVVNTEKIYDAPGAYHNEEVTKTYEENYAAIGGAIGFGLIAAASLVAFAIGEKKNEKGNV